jgi:hypothetical protein
MPVILQVFTNQKLKMKKVTVEASAQIKGGWSWSQHVGCAITGVIVGGGVLGAAGYVGCLLLVDNDCSLCCGSLCGQ